MGIKNDFLYKGIVRPNAYTNISVFNLQKSSGDWKMNIVTHTYNDKDDVLMVSDEHKNCPHIPGACIHQEAYDYIKTLPEFIGWSDDI